MNCVNCCFVAIATEALNLMTPTIKALVNEDVLLVAIKKGQPIENLKLNPISDHIRLEKFLTHAHPRALRV